MTYDARMPSSPPTGRLHGSIAGCEIGPPLGVGGMATTYEARDLDTGARLALKLVLRQPGPDGRVILEAEREGALLQQRLGDVDPRVVRIYRYGEDGDYFFVQMELVEGKDLSHVLDDGPIPIGEAVRIGMEVGGVLRSAHSLSGRLDDGDFRGVVHGDIKSRNIRITPDGRVKVLDFGIAKALSLSRRLTRNEFGSLHYSSPERLETGTVDERSDLWSLGVVLYEMLSGRLPFRGETEEKLERRIRDRRPPPPLVECDTRLRRIVEKALAPRLERRYADASSMLADLVAYVEGRPTAADGDPGMDQSTSGTPSGVSGPDAATKISMKGEADRASAAEGTGLDEATHRTTTAEAAVEDDTTRTMPASRAPADDDVTRQTAGGGAIAGDDATRRTNGPRFTVEEDTTRRTTSPGAVVDEDATRRTTVGGGVIAGDDATRRTIAHPAMGAAGTTAPQDLHATTAPPKKAVDPRREKIKSRLRLASRLALLAAILWALFAVSAQWRILGRSRTLAGDLAAARASNDEAFQEYQELARRAWTPLLVQPLRSQLLNGYRSVADAVIEEYRSSDSPLVRERDWQRASAAITNALALTPRDKALQARQELVEGHLLRIDLRGRRPDQGRIQEAIHKFRQSAELADWGDPYLGLAALQAYVQHDVDETDAAVEKSTKQGLRPGRRERAEKADARLLRATDLWADRGSLARLPEESKYLEKIRSHLSEAIDLYGTVLGFENTHANLRKARQLRDRVDERLAALETERKRHEPPLPWLFRWLQGNKSASEGA